MQIMTNLMKIASYLAHGILSTGEHAFVLNPCPAQLPI